MRSLPILLFLLSISISVSAQDETKYKVVCMGFYNLGNLFDTLNTPNLKDEDFSPIGTKKYNTAIYQEKITHLAKAISEIGTELTPHGAALLGVAGVENKAVLQDLTAHPLIASRRYQILHADSPDEQGLDVALLYQPHYFAVIRHRTVPIKLVQEDGSKIVARDLLWVTGNFDGEPMHLLINHWPSREGGTTTTRPYRNACASVNKKIVDALTAVDKTAKVIIMGDMNDDPTSSSIREGLKPSRKKERTKPGTLFNPMEELYRSGLGSYYSKAKWNLFDQILVTSGWLDETQANFFFKTAKIFNKPYLQYEEGEMQGQPKGTFYEDAYMGGYSDHFPVYAFFLKKI